MPSYHACEQCQRGIHGECGGVDDHCACLACNSDLTDDEIASAPSTGERLTAPDDEEVDE